MTHPGKIRMQLPHRAELRNRSMMMVLALVPVLASGCKSDPKTTAEPNLAGTAAPGSAAAATPAAHQPVRLEVSIDGRAPTKFTIPAEEPATIERQAWPKQLGFFATSRSADEIELEIAVLPKDPTHGSIDLAVFKKQIAATRAMKPGQPIALSPGTSFPGDGFGDSVPHEIKITWVR